jgi:hypothetical protein
VTNGPKRFSSVIQQEPDLETTKTLEGRIESVPPFVEGIMEIVTSMGCWRERKEVEIALLEALRQRGAARMQERSIEAGRSLRGVRQ